MELAARFTVLKKEFTDNPYPSLAERKAVLTTLKKALQTQANVLADAISKDFVHRSRHESLFLEILPTIRAIDYCLKKIKCWMKPRKRHVSLEFLPASAQIVAQPLGVVGNISPWNYPLYLSVMPMVFALAAGNRVMIKVSELSPELGRALDSLVRSVHLDNYIQVVNGDRDVARQFGALPFSHLLFTGSTTVGKLVMKAASDNLTPVTLELGGKSPVLISASMNTAYFKRLLMGKFFNAGQTCIAPDYLLIPEGWESRIEAACQDFLQAHYPNLMQNSDYSSIIPGNHKTRLLELVEDAVAKGARLVTFGSLEPESTKLPIYLLFDVTNDMRVMQEEIFGSILPVVTYKSLNDAVAYINAKSHPLVVYYFGEDKKEQQTILTGTMSGSLTINDTIMQVALDDLPFGGVGCSGMGRYHGQEGFDTFSNLKSVMIQKRFSSATLLYPPYGRLMRWVLALLGGIKSK